jgi:hypothetical protein
MKEPAARNPGSLTPAVVGVGLAVLAAVLVVVFLRQQGEWLARGWTEMRVFLGAARILAGPRPDLLYDWVEQQRQQLDWPGPATPCPNPPFVPLLFIPLLPLSHAAALNALAVAEALILVAAMVVVARMARISSWPVLGLAVLAQPVMLLIWLTVQPAPLTVLAWALFAAAWVRGAPGWAAAAVVGGMAVKPHLMLPLAFFLGLAGGRRAWAVLGGGAVVLLLLAWLMIGTEGIMRFPTLMRMYVDSGSHWSINAKSMVNLRGLLVMTLGNINLSHQLALAGLGVCMAGIGWAARSPQGTARQRALAALVALAGTMLASYHMHLQELPGLFVLLGLAIVSGWIPRERFVYALLGLVVLLWAYYLGPDLIPRLRPVVPHWLVACLNWAFRASVPLGLLALFAVALRDCRHGAGTTARPSGTIDPQPANA